MVLESLLNLFTFLLEFIFALLPEAPDLSKAGALSGLISLTGSFLSSSLSLFFVFVRKSTVIKVFPILLFIFNLDFILSVIRWIWSKIPFIGGK